MQLATEMSVNVEKESSRRSANVPAHFKAVESNNLCLNVYRIHTLVLTLYCFYIRPKSIIFQKSLFGALEKIFFLLIDCKSFVMKQWQHLTNLWVSGYFCTLRIICILGMSTFLVANKWIFSSAVHRKMSLPIDFLYILLT